MSDEPRELIWVSKSLHKRLQVTDSAVCIGEEAMRQLIDELREEINTLNDCTDQHVLSFKKDMLVVRETYKKVVEAEVAESYKAWEALDKQRCEMNTRLERTSDLIRSVKDDLANISNQVRSINVHGIDDMLDLIDRVKNLSNDDRELLMKLFEIQRRDVHD